MSNLYDNYCGQRVLVALPGNIRLVGEIERIIDGFLILRGKCGKIYAINIENILFISPVDRGRDRVEDRF